MRRGQTVLDLLGRDGRSYREIFHVWSGKLAKVITADINDSMLKMGREAAQYQRSSGNVGMCRRRCRNTQLSLM